MDHQWLKSQFALHPVLSKADLARALNLDPPAVSKMLAGTRQIKAQEYVAMRTFFGMPSDGHRAMGAGASAATQGYTLKAFAEPDGGRDIDAWSLPAMLMARKTRAAPEQVRVFDIGDNTMAPDFMPGEHVLVDLSDRQPSPPGVFLVFDGVGHSLRQGEIVPHAQPAQVRFSAVNRNYESRVADLEKAGIAGRVIAKLQWL